MNPLLFRLDLQINGLFDFIDRIALFFPVSPFKIFEEVIYKFNIFYKVIYEQLDLSSADIEIMLDTIRLYDCYDETQLLHQLARCIDTNIKIDNDPIHCFKPEQIHDFIRILSL